LLRVLQRKDAAGERRNIEDPEEIRMDEANTGEFGTIGHLNAHLSAVIVSQGIEKTIEPPNIDFISAGHCIRHPSRRSGADLDPHDAVRIRIFQRFQNNSVEHGEHCCACADTNAEDRNDRESEARRLGERTQDIAYVTLQIIDQRKRAGFALQFFGLFDASEREFCSPVRFFRGEAASSVFVFDQTEMG
jgi:hypothetical protein